MAMTETYADAEPRREDIDARRGPLVLEFGSPTCGFCREAQPLLAEALADFPQLEHIKIADGRGRRLGRTFGVKLWPTLVFLRDGQEVDRVVRPNSAEEIRRGLEMIGN